MPVTDARAAVRRPDRDRDRLVLVEQQRRHRGAGAQPVAAGRAGQRLDGVAELAQALDVAPDGAPGDLEPLGQLAARPVAARLEQREEIEEAAGGVAIGHVRDRGQILT